MPSKGSLFKLYSLQAFQLHAGACEDIHSVIERSYWTRRGPNLQVIVLF